MFRLKLKKIWVIFFHPLEVVARGSETQLLVDENINCLLNILHASNIITGFFSEKKGAWGSKCLKSCAPVSSVAPVCDE